jgi:hypothetical protein
VRVPNDAYETPAWCVEEFFAARGMPDGPYWLDPCVGSGAILRAVQRLSPDRARYWRGVELRGEEEVAPSPWPVECCVEIAWRTDFLTWHPRCARPNPFDVAIMNPPYRLAEEFVRKALTVSREVVVLLRLGFLASQKRAEWLRECPPDVYVLPKRPSFTGKGTDATDYAWMVWRSDPGEERYAGSLQVLRVPG